MMKTVFTLLLILFLAFTGYHLTFRTLRLPLFAKKFSLTGTEFLFFGLLLGPVFFNVLDDETLRGLEPLRAMLLGWIGMLFGFQFELRALIRFPAAFFAAAAMESLVTFMVTFSGLQILFLYVDFPFKPTFPTMLVLAATASCTAQTGLGLLPPSLLHGRKHLLQFLGYISGIDGLFSLFFLGIAFFLFPSPVPFQRVLLGTFGGCTGLLFCYLLFLNRRLPESELSLVVVGMTVFTSGIASASHFSPLLGNFFIGFFLVNLSRDKERILKMLSTIEKPTYLLLLVFLGAYWQPDTLILLLFAGGYAMFRLTGKIIGGRLITRHPSFHQYPFLLGFGLTDAGGL